MADQWFTARELEGQPGMPKTFQGVLHRANREGWTSRTRKGRGGGNEYSLDSLPTETRTALALRSDPDARSGADAARKLRATEQVSAEQAWAGRQAGMAAMVGLSAKEQARMDAKLEVLDAVDRLRRNAALSHKRAILLVVERYNACELDISPATREVLGPDISPSSLYRWTRKLTTEGPAALAGQYKATQQAAIDDQPELFRFCEAFISEYTECRATQLERAIHVRFRGREDLRMPSRRAVQRWLKAYRERQHEVLTRIRNPDEWKGRYMTATGSASEGIERINQVWELDSTPGDIMLQDGRHALIGVIDVATRRAKLLVSKTSHAVAVASLTRRTLLDWGAPEVAKTDNGSDYTSHHMRRVFSGLGIEQVCCQPFQPWQKPHIEKFFRSFQHDLVELLPGFIGHSVSERQALEERRAFSERLFRKGEAMELRMTAAEFQRFADDWVENIYHHRPHHGEGMDGATPFERAQDAPGVIRRVQDERALDVLLAEAPGEGQRRVRKKGIHLDHGIYDAPELADIRGETVHVRYDETDYGRIYVYHHGEFLCIAEDPSVAGVSRKEVAQEQRRRQAQRVEAERRRLREVAKQERVRDVAQEIVAASREDRDKIAAFPRAETDYTSDGIEAAREAADAREQIDQPPELAPVDEQALAEVTQLLRDEQTQDETAEDRFRRWIRLHELEQDGAGLPETDRYWKQRYEDTSEWRGRYLVFEEYGSRPWSGGEKAGAE